MFGWEKTTAVNPWHPQQQEEMVPGMGQCRAVATAQTWLSPLQDAQPPPAAATCLCLVVAGPGRAPKDEGVRNPRRDQEEDALNSSLFISSREIKPTQALGHAGAPFETGSEQKRLLLLELPP